MNRRDRRRLGKQGIVDVVDPDKNDLELKLHVVPHAEAIGGFKIPMKYLYFTVLQPSLDVAWIEEVRRIKRDETHKSTSQAKGV